MIGERMTEIATWIQIPNSYNILTDLEATDDCGNGYTGVLQGCYATVTELVEAIQELPQGMTYCIGEGDNMPKIDAHSLPVPWVVHPTLKG